jgi:2OG-Fe(II) oxygenase superfamily
VIRIITGCVQISDFIGRVYRMEAGPQRQLAWHGDTIDRQRQVGFSMNLSTDVFRGGTFELRDRWTLGPLAQVNNTGIGDALLFRISKDLEHRVTEVVDKVAKIACAGWFRATGVSLFAELVGRSASVPMTQSGQN